MNVQTELLENRIAHLKVAIEDAELDKAKRQAARRLAQRVNIPGFRKGKAPYDIIIRYLGEGAVLEEAIDKLGPEIYREALENSELEPYGPGQLENIEDEGDLTFVFSVPLIPTVDLGDYRAVRCDYEPQEATDEMVDTVLKALQDRKAVIEPKDGPAADGDQVVLDIHGTLVPEEAEPEQPSAEDAEESSDTEEPQEQQETEDEVLFNQKGWRFVLGDEDGDLMPGFSAAITGITAEEERPFELTFPAEDEDLDETMLGRTVRFTVTAQEISARHIPSINDDFAQQLDDYEVETLLDLRLKLREDLQARLDEQTASEYADKALTQIVEGTTIEYPELMVDEYIDGMIENFQEQLRQQNLTLQDFLNFNQMEMDALREQYREPAIERLKRSLVMGKLVEVEELDVDEALINREIKARSAQLSQGNPEMQGFFEQYFSAERGRRDLAINLLTQHTMTRLVAIAKGENPPVGLPPVEDEPEMEPEPAEASTERAESEVSDDQTPVEADEPVEAGEMGEAAPDMDSEAAS